MWKPTIRKNIISCYSSGFTVKPQPRHRSVRSYSVLFICYTGIKATGCAYSRKVVLLLEVDKTRTARLIILVAVNFRNISVDWLIVILSHGYLHAKNRSLAFKTKTQKSITFHWNIDDVLTGLTARMVNPCSRCMGHYRLRQRKTKTLVDSKSVKLFATSELRAGTGASFKFKLIDKLTPSYKRSCWDWLFDQVWRSKVEQGSSYDFWNMVKDTYRL